MDLAADITAGFQTLLDFARERCTQRWPGQAVAPLALRAVCWQLYHQHLQRTAHRLDATLFFASTERETTGWIVPAIVASLQALSPQYFEPLKPTQHE